MGSYEQNDKQVRARIGGRGAHIYTQLVSPYSITTPPPLNNLHSTSSSPINIEIIFEAADYWQIPPLGRACVSATVTKLPAVEKHRSRLYLYRYSSVSCVVVIWKVSNFPCPPGPSAIWYQIVGRCRIVALPRHKHVRQAFFKALKAVQILSR